MDLPSILASIPWGFIHELHYMVIPGTASTCGIIFLCLDILIWLGYLSARPFSLFFSSSSSFIFCLPKPFRWSTTYLSCVPMLWACQYSIIRCLYSHFKRFIDQDKFQNHFDQTGFDGSGSLGRLIIVWLSLVNICHNGWDWLWSTGFVYPSWSKQTFTWIWLIMGPQTHTLEKFGHLRVVVAHLNLHRFNCIKIVWHQELSIFFFLVYCPWCGSGKVRIENDSIIGWKGT